MKILVADDSKATLAVITASLTDLGHTVFPAASGLEAIEIFKLQHPDLIILDVVMEGIDGFETAKRIRAIDVNEWIPIIFLSAIVDDNSIAKGIDAGGDDYLTKPYSDITLSAKIKAMERIAEMRNKILEMSHQLQKLSFTDPLTGLDNRLHFDRVIKERMSDAERHSYTIGILFLDLDKFKIVNDTFGHRVGDSLLIQVAKRLKSCLRLSDFSARIGGDEFAIITSKLNDPGEINLIADKIVRALSQKYSIEGHIVKIGVSIGVAYYPQSGLTFEEIISKADEAMYHAKQLGGNQFEVTTSL